MHLRAPWCLLWNSSHNVVSDIPQFDYVSKLLFQGNNGTPLSPKPHTIPLVLNFQANSFQLRQWPMGEPFARTSWILTGISPGINKIRGDRSLKSIWGSTSERSAEDRLFSRVNPRGKTEEDTKNRDRRKLYRENSTSLKRAWTTIFEYLNITIFHRRREREPIRKKTRA